MVQERLFRVWFRSVFFVVSESELFTVESALRSKGLTFKITSCAM